MNNEKKLQYEEPKMSIVIFETVDIIITSVNGFEGNEDSLLPD